MTDLRCPIHTDMALVPTLETEQQIIKLTCPLRHCNHEHWMTRDVWERIVKPEMEETADE